MTDKKILKQLKELRRQAGYEPSSWYEQKEEECLVKALSTMEQEVRKETEEKIEKSYQKGFQEGSQDTYKLLDIAHGLAKEVNKIKAKRLSIPKPRQEDR